MEILGGALCLALLLPTRPVRACELAIVWKADLTGSAKTAAGTATIQFDFTHPGALVQINASHLSDVRTIELHVSRSYSDHTGPSVLTLYTPADGPLPAAFRKQVTEADLQTQTAPKIAAFSDLVQAVLGRRAYVLVTTKAHPEGEWSGFITMRKEAVYSDNPADTSHDPALHHAAQTP